jgi:deoxyinosine 3'endonuclease (endonuclease V)
VGGSVDALKPLAAHVGVDLRRAQVGVAEEFLHSS